MTHEHADNRRTSLDRERTHDGAGHGRAQPPGTKWRSALAALVAAPVRLHRYRNFHAEVVEDALRAYDCRKCQ